jgi:protocatechuate 3,4-dioxygenase, alpha subunit
MSLRASTSQTIGPYLRIGLEWMQIEDMAPKGVAGERVSIRGRVLDADGKPVNDAAVEVWQANSHGRYASPEDKQDKPLEAAFRGYGRSLTDDQGAFRFQTIKPGRVPGPDGKPQAPHLNVVIFMRGLLKQLMTRMYFPDDAANGEDPILALVPAARRPTLVARRAGSDLEWNVILQGRDAPGPRRDGLLRLLGGLGGAEALLHVLADGLALHRRARSVDVPAPDARLLSLRERGAVRAHDLVLDHERLAAKAHDAGAHLAAVAVQGGREELALRRHQRHGHVLLAHPLRSVADAFEQVPARGVDPAEISGIENDASGIAIAPVHLAREAIDDGGESGRLAHGGGDYKQARLTPWRAVGRLPLLVSGARFCAS